MKAMLLAAGLGTRLWPLTADRPKCMVPVGGRAVILRNIEWLRTYGIEDVVINLHHHAEAVKDTIRDGSRFGVNATYSPEAELLGTAGGVLAARELIGDDTFLVVYADNLFAVDLRSVIAEHRHADATATVAVFERDAVSSSGVAVLDADGWILEFQEKPAQGTEKSHWVNAGLLVCEPKLYDFIPAEGPSDLSYDVLPTLAGLHQELRAYRLGSEERVMWIDTMADLLRTEEALLNPNQGSSR